MTRSVLFAPPGWRDYQFWCGDNRTELGKVNDIVNDCLRDPFKGLGKPEPLKNRLKGYWSRRISGEHRLVYGVHEEHIIIVQCRFHYDDK
ncbi:Txe/YoeB family addiction module toxin [Paraburkholderia sediminicola]|uniref:Txe/YoeB family addiction module toxin n=1 Tax=Paraburkholderia sediminicola TaxID=458836 RepID=UPI0038B734F1